MKFYLSETHSDEEGPQAVEGKLGILYANETDLIRLSEFIQEAVDHLKSNDFCHLHFRDSFDQWDKTKHIDLEINVDKRKN